MKEETQRERDRPRDDPGHPFDRDAGGPVTYARPRLPGEPTFIPDDRRRTR